MGLLQMDQYTQIYWMKQNALLSKNRTFYALSKLNSDSLTPNKGPRVSFLFPYHKKALNSQNIGE